MLANLARQVDADAQRGIHGLTAIQYQILHKLTLQLAQLKLLTSPDNQLQKAAFGAFRRQTPILALPSLAHPHTETYLRATHEARAKAASRTDHRDCSVITCSYSQLQLRMWSVVYCQGASCMYNHVALV